MPHEFDGEKYKKASTHQKEWGNKIIAELTLKGNESILDLGCGDGVLTEQLAQLVPNGKAVGVDTSAGMIKEANKLTAKNLNFIHSDINHLALNSSYDIIFSNATLHWIKDHKKLITTLLNHLNTGGIARLNFASDGNCANFFSVVKEEIARENTKDCFTAFKWPWYMPDIAEYTDLLSHFNLKELEVWEENADRYFPDKEAITQWIDQPSIVPFLSYIDTQEAKDEFRNSIVHKVIERTLQDDDTCFETFRRINIKFRK